MLIFAVPIAVADWVLRVSRSHGRRRRHLTAGFAIFALLGVCSLLSMAARRSGQEAGRTKESSREQQAASHRQQYCDSNEALWSGLPLEDCICAGNMRKVRLDTVVQPGQPWTCVPLPMVAARLPAAHTPDEESGPAEYHCDSQAARSLERLLVNCICTQDEIKILLNLPERKWGCRPRARVPQLAQTPGSVEDVWRTSELVAVEKHAYDKEIKYWSPFTYQLSFLGRQKIELLVGVSIARSNRAGRSRLRQVWSETEKFLTSRGVPTKVVFILGSASLEDHVALEGLLKEELREYKDILVIPDMKDTAGGNFNAKSLLAFYEKLTGSSLRFDAFMKADNDTHVDPVQFLSQYLHVRPQLVQDNYVAWWSSPRFDSAEFRPKTIPLTAKPFVQPTGPEATAYCDYAIAAGHELSADFPVYAVGPAHVMNQKMFYRLGGDIKSWGVQGATKTYSIPQLPSGDLWSDGIAHEIWFEIMLGWDHEPLSQVQISSEGGHEIVALASIDELQAQVVNPSHVGGPAEATAEATAEAHWRLRCQRSWSSDFVEYIAGQ